MWCGGRVFIQRENIVAVCSTLYSSLIIVISLQCNSVDVGKLPNYVNTILCVWLFFFGVCFLYFFVSHRLGIWFNSLHADSHSIDIHGAHIAGKVGVLMMVAASFLFLDIRDWILWAVFGFWCWVGFVLLICWGWCSVVGLKLLVRCCWINVMWYGNAFGLGASASCLCFLCLQMFYHQILWGDGMDCFNSDGECVWYNPINIATCFGSYRRALHTSLSLISHCQLCCP